MIKPVQKAPKAFADRYNRIVDGEEVIDTIAKLKEFWLFAIEQGKPHPEMREYIASLAYCIPTSRFVNSMIFSEYELHEAYIQLETFIKIGDSPYSNMTDREYHDSLWEECGRLYISIIDATALDKKLDVLKSTPQLTPKQIEKFLSEFKINR